jgi:hypothetical protein
MKTSRPKEEELSGDWEKKLHKSLLYWCSVLHFTGVMKRG